MLKWSLCGVRQEYRVDASLLPCFISPLLWQIRSICFCWLRLIHTFMYGCLYSSVLQTEAFVRCKKKYLSCGTRCQQVTGSFYFETFMLLLLFV